VNCYALSRSQSSLQIVGGNAGGAGSVGLEHLGTFWLRTCWGWLSEGGAHDFSQLTRGTFTQKVEIKTPIWIAVKIAKFPETKKNENRDKLWSPPTYSVIRRSWVARGPTFDFYFKQDLSSNHSQNRKFIETEIICKTNQLRCDYRIT
jgi:hypothetical protein